jgi:hypothetical protein
MNSSKNIASPEDVLIFDKAVLLWQQLLNLQDWRIEPGGRPVKNAMACIEFNPPARLAVYSLGDFGAEAITSELLKKVALHELLHVLLFDLIEVATGRPTDDELEGAEHKVVNVLEKLLMGLLHD